MIWPLTAFILGWLPAWLAISAMALEMVIRVVVVGIIPGGRRPNTAMAWLLAIFLVPLIALPLFGVFGTNRLSRQRPHLQRPIHADLAEALRDTGAVVPHERRLRATVDMNLRLGAFPIRRGNRLRLLPDYEQSFRWLVEAVDAAERYVHVLFYAVSDAPEYAGPVPDGLERATA